MPRKGGSTHSTKNGLPAGEGGVGRIPTLTPAVHETVIQGLRAGQTLYTAAGIAGVRAQQVADWFRLGARLVLAAEKAETAGQPIPPLNAFQRRLVKLSVDANKAIRMSEARSVAGILAAARQTTKKTSTTTRTTRDKEGNAVTVTTVTEEEIPPDWKAEAWYAERRFAKSWGRATTLALQIADEELPAGLDVGDDESDTRTAAEDIQKAAALIDELAALRARKNRALKKAAPADDEPEDAEIVEDGEVGS